MAHETEDCGNGGGKMTYDRGFVCDCPECGKEIDMSDYRCWGMCRECWEKEKAATNGN